MSTKPQETTHTHTRLLKCALEIEDARAYWAHTDGSSDTTAQQAFDDYWFGARSLARVEVLLANMRARFSAFPAALQTLHRWPHMPPDTRKIICHWHLQVADPLYRAFTGDFMVERRNGPRPELTRDLVVGWVGQQGPDRWTMPTRIQFASKLLSSAFSAGLVGTNRDPRPLILPRVGDDALEYLLYFLREFQFEGTLMENPYLASLGLQGGALDERLRSLPGMAFQRQGDLIDFRWRYANLQAWAEANLVAPGAEKTTGGAP
jgi:hypothetical protein